MYYSIDPITGLIITSESSDILPDPYQEVFPEDISDIFEDTVSDGDSYIPYPTIDPDEFISDNDLVTHDDLIDMLALIPGYNVYPNTTAVSIFSDVLNNIDGHIGYVIISGSDTNTTNLYYSSHYTVSGKTIVLQSPVTYCNYYQYRPTSSSNYIYTYSVSSIGETSFNLTNQLVYTNLLEGYPDVLPYKQREIYSLFYVIAFALLLLFIILFVRNRGRVN